MTAFEAPSVSHRAELADPVAASPSLRPLVTGHKTPPLPGASQSTGPQPVTERVPSFARWLREQGLPVGPAEQQAMLQATLALGSTHARANEAAWRAIACGNARHWRQWPDLFEQYWYPQRVKGTVKVSGSTRPRRDLRQAVAQMQESMADTAAAKPGSASAQMAADHAGGEGTQDGIAPRAMGGASQVEALHDRSQQMWMPQDLQALQKLAQEIYSKLRPRPTRRWQLHPAGDRLAFRTTLRRSVAFGGLPLQPAWQRPQTEPPQLFILVDVSRSMEAHAAFFLRVARAFARCAHARVFVFHVRLAEVSALMQRDNPTVQERINAVTAGFGAGTRIAANLKVFTREHARAQLGSRSRVWIFSDGFDTDEPQELEQALQGLRRHGARVTWFHPTRQRPASIAIERARACIDQFLPLANLNDLVRARHRLH